MKLPIPECNTVLVAPLNWGLGHASRSMVIIDQLIAQNKKVVIASDGIALQLLKEEYPNLDFVELPSYDIHYEGKSFVFSMIKQIPKIQNAIRSENRALKNILLKHSIDLIISDNRYGIFDRNIASILLTHQLRPHSKSSVLKWFAYIVVKKLSSSFHQIWVPDDNNRTLSGDLSNAKGYKNVHFIGKLSRMDFRPIQFPSIDSLAILSGPEPARTLFENKIIEIFSKKNGNHTIIRGTHKPVSEAPKNIRYINLGKQKEIENLINDAKEIICRAGYSSIMDYIDSSKSIILVPTPGQTEQEYLADHLNGTATFTKLEESQLLKHQW